MIFLYKNAILSVSYRFLRIQKDMVRRFLVVVIFVPFLKAPGESGLRKIWV